MSGSKFKKGDRVLLLLGSGKDEGTVEDIIPGHPRQFLFDRFGVRFQSGAKFYYQAHDLGLISPKFDFQVGDKLTTPNWSDTPERFVTVEWIGPYQFAGVTNAGKKVVHDFASANSRWQKWVRTYHFPFKVGDRLQQMYVGAPTFLRPVTVQSVGEPTDRSFETLEDGHSRAKVMGGGYTWELVPEHEVPAPGTSGAHDAATSTSCEPEPAPVPTVKKWLVITEDRVPEHPEVYVSRSDCKPVQTGDRPYFSTQHVITSVQPLTNLNDWIVGGDGK